MADFPLPAPRTWEELRSGTVSWLSERWGPDWREHRCPCCENQGWVLGDVLALERAAGWPSHSAGAVTPMLQVVCTKCSHAVLLNAQSVFRLHEQPLRGEQRPTMY